MKKLFLTVIILLLITFSYAEKAPFSIDALYQLKSISSPEISPNGKWIAFVVTEYDLYKSRKNADIYIISIDGKELKRLTYNEASDYSPIWSDDSEHIYFLSTRNDGTQLWKIAIDGGEPQQITNLELNGFKNIHIVDHGRKIIFSTKIFPECGNCLKCSKEKREKMENGPTQAHYTKELLYRHWDEYRDGQYENVFIYDIEKDTAINLTPWKFDAPMFALSGTHLDVSPDNKKICVVSNHDKNQACSTNGDLWLVDIETGKAENITKNNRAWDGQPLFSPDGRYIAYKTQKTPGYESDLFRLAICDLKTGKSKILSEGKIDNWVDDYVWSPDSRHIYFTVEEKGHYPVYKVNIESGKIEKVFDVKTLRYLSLTPDGKYFIFTRSTINKPYELYRINSNGKGFKRLTFFNKEIEEKYDLRQAKEFWIPGAEGKLIQTWLITPYGFDPNEKYPLIINVHGGPQQMWYDGFRGDWQIYPGHGYAVAFCNPHGSPGYGQKFVEAISKDWGGKVCEDIMKVVDSLANLPYIDEDKLGAMGWSYGGYMMMWLEGHTDRFKAIVAMMGVYDLVSMYGATEELWFPEWELAGAPWESPEIYKKWSPSSYAKNFKTPCLVITGEKDYRVPYTQSLQFFTALQKMGVPSELIVFKNDGHWPDYLKSMPLYYNVHLYWFHKFLGGKPAPFSMEELIYNEIFKTD